MNAAAHNVHMACPEIHRALKSVEVDVSGRKSSMQEKLNWTNPSPIRNFPVPIMTSFRLKTMLQNHFLKVVAKSRFLILNHRSHRQQLGFWETTHLPLP